MVNGWTDWIGIDEHSDYQNSAVYKVRLVDSNEKCCQLERLLKPDEEGIMCIGQTSNMERRRKQFKTAIGKGKGHSSGNLVWYLNKNSNLQGKSPSRFQNFQYRFRKCSNDYRCKNDESVLIKKYFREFGEVPPLNSSIPKRDEKTKGWNVP